MYSILEKQGEGESTRVSPIQGYDAVPEDEIEYVVNCLRREGRDVLPVLEVREFNPFEEERRSYRLPIFLGILAIAAGVGIWQYPHELATMVASLY